MGQPVKLYPETTPRWLSVVTPIETAFEKKRRIEAEFQKVEQERLQLKAYFDAKNEALDDHELRLHDQIQRTNRELEELGEDV
jgi:hypothetical protein